MKKTTLALNLFPLVLIVAAVILMLVMRFS